MPAYNESGCIETVVRSWLPVLDKIPGQLIVVNDGSKDDTGAILDRLAQQDSRIKVIHQANAGHGAAVLRGYQAAIDSQATYVFQTDSDDQFRPDDFWKLWEKRGLSPFILAYRKSRSDALHRLLITRIVIGINFLLFGVRLRDANNPFRLMRAAFLRELLKLFPNNVFAPNIFLSVLAAKSGLELFDIPVGHRDRQTGQVSIIKWKLVKVCLRCVRELVDFRISLVRNKHLIPTAEQFVEHA